MADERDTNPVGNSDSDVFRPVEVPSRPKQSMQNMNNVTYSHFRLTITRTIHSVHYVACMK